MENNYYGHDYYEKFDKSITKLWFIFGLLILGATLSIISYYIIDSKTTKVNKNVNYTNLKIDSVLYTQSDIISELTNVNNKLDESNKMIIDSIFDLQNRVIRVNKNINKVAANVDTIVIYIKK